MNLETKTTRQEKRTINQEIKDNATKYHRKRNNDPIKANNKFIHFNFVYECYENEKVKLLCNDL